MQALMILGVSSSLTSCQDILGEWDKPTPTVTPPTTPATETGTITYMAWNSTSQALEPQTLNEGEYEVMTSSTTTWTSDKPYVVNDDITLSDVTLSGDVKLILCDDKTLTVNGTVYGGTYVLNVYGKDGDDGDGELSITSATDNAIGLKAAILNVHSGKITVNVTGEDAQAIETTIYPTNDGEFNVYGGKVTANGIMEGIMVDYMTIYGGTVIATGGCTATSSGGTGQGGIGLCGTTITINGGTVTATGGNGFAGTNGNGGNGITANVTINGCTLVTATGGDLAGTGSNGEGFDNASTITIDASLNYTVDGAASGTPNPANNKVVIVQP